MHGIPNVKYVVLQYVHLNVLQQDRLYVQRGIVIKNGVPSTNLVPTLWLL